MKLDLPIAKALIEPFNKNHFVKCPRCKKRHHCLDNFGFTAAQIIEDSTLATQKLCDRCSQIVIDEWPNHWSTEHIKRAMERQRQPNFKYSQSLSEIILD